MAKDRKVSQHLVSVHEALGLETALSKGVQGLNCAATLISALMRHKPELLEKHFREVASGLLSSQHFDPAHFIGVPLLYTGTYEYNGG